MIVLFFMFSCSCNNHQFPYYERLADQITAKTAKKLRKEKNLYLIGTGGRMMDDIKMMAMAFNYYHAVDLENARELLLYAAKEYLSAINSNDKLRPYLHDYPFTDKNIEISIYFFNQDGTHVSLQNINVASADEGVLSYYVDYPDKYTLKLIHRESYEDAANLITK